MTAQESFERGFHIQFYKEEPMIILLFQHKELYQEAYENIKNKFQGSKLFLEIIMRNHLIQLIIRSNDDNILKSNELEFNKEKLEDFINEVDTEQRISLFTDYATFANGAIFPLSKWIHKQQNDRIYLNGYKVVIAQ